LRSLDFVKLGAKSANQSPAASSMRQVSHG
jgi:hypothetical protein